MLFGPQRECEYCKDIINVYSVTCGFIHGKEIGKMLKKECLRWKKYNDMMTNEIREERILIFPSITRTSELQVAEKSPETNSRPRQKILRIRPSS